MKRNRVSLQASPLFRDSLLNLQKSIRAKGIDKSLTDITEDLSKSGLLNDFEKKLIKKDDIYLRFDKRRKCF